MIDISDMQLLREYADNGDEAAFRQIVDRHADIVYSAALRQVLSEDLARDVAQTVFTDLARKASSVVRNPSMSLVGWLYRGTRFIALNQLREDRRRQLRERKAMEQFDPASDSPSNWNHIGPMLDEAMSELNDEDREVLLLRFFKKLEFRAVGEALGISGDAAQKRVSRALEKLRTEFARRGVSTASAALGSALLAHTVIAAPTGLAAALSTGALATTSAAGVATATTGKIIAMTTLQKAVIGAIITTAIGTGIYEHRQAARMREQVKLLEEQQAQQSVQTRQLQRERDDATNQLAALKVESGSYSSNQATPELLKLRAEIAQLRRQLAQSPGNAINTNDPFTASVLSLTTKAAELNQYLQRMPEKSIPELRFLSENDWLTAAKEAKFDNDSGIRMALSHLRGLAKTKMPMGGALSSYIFSHDGQLPTDVSQLKSSLILQMPAYDPTRDDAIVDSILSRYKLVRSGNVKDLPSDAWILVEKAPVDPGYDSKARYANGRSSVSNIGIGEAPDPGD